MILAIIGAMMLGASPMPEGPTPDPVAFPHFPDRVHAFVWRNWPLVPVDRMAEVLDTEPEQVLQIGKAMGLSESPVVTDDQRRRSYITVIRRNWHLLPYEQLLQLLGWTDEELAFTLREDDFLYIKLGQLKPKCEPLKFQPADEATQRRETEIATAVREAFPNGIVRNEEPLFDFVRQLSEPSAQPAAKVDSRFSPRYCYSYFALYGDPLLDTQTNPYPDGYLDRLVASGVDGVWLQGVMYKLAPFPWKPELSEHYEERLENLRKLVARAREHGVGIYLYLNEPRAMPLAFYEAHPELKGATEGDHSALCSSHPDVQAYMRDSVASICRAVPDLAGFFTITASENLTNCWSHYRGAECPRCSKRTPAETIAEVNRLIQEGIDKAGTATKLIAWDWGWQNEWAEAAIRALPPKVLHMSVSEWDIPIERGGVASRVGEYSISTVGPGPRATRHWKAAQEAGLKTVAKIQAGNTWELSTVPYIPAVANVAQHAANLRDSGVSGLMLGWTLGGYPSPNLEVVAEISRADAATPLSVDDALNRVAERRFGSALASAVVTAWKAMSVAFSEFPYSGGVVYNAPHQVGPANLLWEAPTGYKATMVGIPYDDLDGWRTIYPPEIFAAQFEKVAVGFDAAIAALREAAASTAASADPGQREALASELDVAETAAINFRSCANQVRFVLARNAEAAATAKEEAQPQWAEIERLLREEQQLATRLYAIQSRDSRIGFEASNHYFFVPIDLAEKVINCTDLLNRWLPLRKARFN